MMKMNRITPSEKRGKVVVVLLIVMFIYSLSIIFIYNIIGRIFGMGQFGGDLESVQSIYTFIGIFSELFSLAVLVSIIFWFVRIYDNYLIMNRDNNNEISKTWAVLYWIIPVVNFVMPCILLLKVSKSMNMQLKSRGLYPKKSLSNGFIIVWWILFLFEFYLMLILGYMQRSLYSDLDMETIILISSLYTMLGRFIALLFVILTFVLVRSYASAERDIINIPPEVQLR